MLADLASTSVHYTLARLLLLIGAAGNLLPFRCRQVLHHFQMLGCDSHHLWMSDGIIQVVCVLMQRWSVCIPLRSGRDCQTHSLRRQNPATFRPSPASNWSRLLSSCVWKREWTWQQGWSNHVSMGQHDCSLVWFTLTPKLVSNLLRLNRVWPNHIILWFTESSALGLFTQLP